MKHLYHKPSPLDQDFTKKPMDSLVDFRPSARLTRIHLWRCQVLGIHREGPSCLLSEKGEHDDNFVELGEIPDIQSYFLDSLVEKNEDAT